MLCDREDHIDDDQVLDNRRQHAPGTEISHEAANLAELPWSACWRYVEIEIVLSFTTNALSKLSSIRMPLIT